MTFDSIQQRPNLTRAPAFIPFRKASTEMQTKDPRLRPCGNDFEKRVSRACRVMPLVIVDLLAAEETDRVISARGPEWKPGRFGDTLDDFRMRRFLKYDQVRRSRNNRFGKRLLP